MTNAVPNRQHILRSLGTEDVEMLLRWFIASRNLGWHPRIWWPKAALQLEEKCQRLIPQLDAYHERRTAAK